MKKTGIIKYIIIIVFFCSVYIINGQTTENYKKGFTSWLPARNADEAILLGNGIMGAMVFGHPHNETIIVNHSALYLPLGIPKKPIHQYTRLPEIRKLILEGNGTEAAKIPVELSKEEGYEGQQWSDPYIPAFDIKIECTPDNIKEYKRSLNFETGESVIRWKQGENEFERHQFISRKHNMLIIQITAKIPFDVSFRFAQRPVQWNQWDYINNNIKSTRIYSENKFLYYQSEFNHQWKGNIAGYEGLGKIISEDGIIQNENNNVKVYKTRNALLIVKLRTFETGGTFNTNELKNAINNLGVDYNNLLEEHKSIHTEIFNRVTFSITDDVDTGSMLDSEVMMQQAKQKNNNAFVEKQFYASRYNILCATGKNPPNLQGIWGSSWQPPWSSDYTHDGNLPVAISSYLCSNMPELIDAYFDYNDDRIPYYNDNAKSLYNCRGIMLPSHSSSHGWNVHFDPIWCLTFWYGGAAWASHFYYDYWLYTNNMDFLINRAYPFMKKTALFYQDFLTIGDNGKYIFNPSYSPENNPANNLSQATINATMDIALAKELLRNLIQVAPLVKEEKNQVEKWKSMLDNIPAYEIDENGVFREWIWPAYQENHKHRHVSQLYGMFDMIDPEIKNDSLLINGIKNAVNERMKVRRKDHGGIMVFGMVQLAWVASNLGDKAMVEEIISWLSSQYWSNSLATFHDPNGLFNMDLSGGFQTVIIKSLLYSEPGYIALLPAKPEMWKKGEIKGILARNQIKINNLSWLNSSVQFSCISPIEQKLTLKLPDYCKTINDIKKTVKILEFDKVNHKAIIIIKANKEAFLEFN